MMIALSVVKWYLPTKQLLSYSTTPVFLEIFTQSRVCSGDHESIFIPVFEILVLYGQHKPKVAVAAARQPHPPSACASATCKIEKFGEEGKKVKFEASATFYSTHKSPMQPLHHCCCCCQQLLFYPLYIDKPQRLTLLTIGS